ncbi:MAG: DUF962 domain-containing protein [Planctomycetota bacterium]|nr:MAG: DUF962 domain-containing protein [Planctomycetota bacterium]
MDAWSNALRNSASAWRWRAWRPPRRLWGPRPEADAHDATYRCGRQRCPVPNEAEIQMTTMTFDQFYREVYLPRHLDKACRAMHVLGLVASVAYVVFVVWLQIWWLLVFAPVLTYLIAWVGHLLVHNTPTFFEFPVWSFAGYWKMIGEIITGRI